MYSFGAPTANPKIKAMGVKMVLSGEGADELFGGYLYFHKAPNPDEFFAETRDKVRGFSVEQAALINVYCVLWTVFSTCSTIARDILPPPWPLPVDRLFHMKVAII